MNWKENWRQIENKYQKAYALWMQFDSPEAKICVTYRDLYDFFDEQKLWITVYITCSNSGFMWEIVKKTGIDEFSPENIIYNPRSKAEEAAFIKAFEILEEKLK